MNGFPIKLETHAQLGIWLTTLHSALCPQSSGHGSLHFWLIQAIWLLHSLLLIHSGLQFGGDPLNSGKQEQDGVLSKGLHIELGPHGFGEQGSDVWTACCSTTG